jgi:ribonuclease HI
MKLAYALLITSRKLSH